LLHDLYDWVRNGAQKRSVAFGVRIRTRKRAFEKGARVKVTFLMGVHDLGSFNTFSANVSTSALEIPVAGSAATAKVITFGSFGPLRFPAVPARAAVFPLVTSNQMASATGLANVRG
jgi:hypothetical protein